MTKGLVTMETEADVVVVGGGNAGFAAAHSAREEGARVLLLERAPKEESGGNSFYTAGAFRLAHDGLATLAPLLAPGEGDRLDRTVLPPYPAASFAADMERVTGGRSDPVLTDLLVDRSTETVRWLSGKGIRWRLMYERQSYDNDGTWTFFGGLALGAAGGGKGLMARHTEAAVASGVDVRYGARVTALHRSSTGAMEGVTYSDATGEHTVRAGAVVLAAGGFEASPGLRARHLGPEWAAAIVRGTPTNDGEILQLALALGAAPHGDYGSCHSVAWDADAPAQGGDRVLTNQYTRQSYPLGIVVDRDGRRFLDEGADYRNYTYAKYGREILLRPGGVAWQLFDAKTRPMLRTEEYDSEPIAGATADTVEDLARLLAIAPEGLRRTVEEFNASIDDVPFDPAVKDGRRANVEPPKSNWALALDTPPFHGYAVSCGITFTFGGLHVDTGARVLDVRSRPIDGLYAAGEIMGGLFSGNYPGGTGLTSGAVFGRIAGAEAARAGRPGRAGRFTAGSAMDGGPV